MNLRVFYLFLAIFFTASLSAQQEAAIWYFGQNAGLDFRSGVPVPLTDGALNTWEGCATISDFNGNLLFYTDGSYVWNRNHLVMPNGNGLLGNSTSSQSAIVVPKPNDPDIYYVFTADYQSGPGGINYSEVDMTLNGGMGDITVKNVQLITPATEKLTAVKHANGTDIWVITHDWRNADFLAYRITPAGVNTTPIRSTVGIDLSTGFASQDAIGYIKASPNGTRLAICHSNIGAEVLDFDVATGVVSNPILLNDVGKVYSVEFSPSSQVLYVSVELNSIYQYDLNAPDVRASQLDINGSNTQEGALQLAIDGKIYSTIFFQNSLSVINNPNVLGLGCNYEYGTVNLGTGVSILGLPPFIQSFFLVSFESENLCFGDTTEFSISASEPIISILWDFGDGNTSTVENATHTYGAPGDYTVNVTVTTASETKTETKEITISEVPVANAVTNVEVCQTVPVYDLDLSSLDAQILGGQPTTDFTVDYFLSQTDADANTNALVQPTTYNNGVTTVYARITNNQNTLCYDTTSFDVVVKEAPELGTVLDWVVCDDNNDGIFTFDLTTQETQIVGAQTASAIAISFHASQTDADSNTNALNAGSYTNITPYQETIYVRVSNTSDTSCYDTTAFDVLVSNTPMIGDVPDWLICDDNNDGLYNFDFSLKDAEILNGLDPMAHTVTYHESQTDADIDINAITGLFQNTGNPQTIFFRVENNSNTTCSNIGSFYVQVFDEPTAYQPSDIIICDIDETGLYQFDLSEKDTEILNGQDAAIYEVSYHPSELDAMNNSNALSNTNYGNTQMSEVIYARVQHGQLMDCYAVNHFSLFVNPLPNPNLEEVYVICPDSPDLQIDGGTFESWEWRNGEDDIIGSQQTQNIVELGGYSLTVTQTTNGIVCEKTMAFEVVSSGAPDSFTVDTSGLSDNVIVMVDAIGIGDFEYSIDGENYQTNNQFEVFPGSYTVYVRDPFECRTLTQDIIAMGYEKFFTPNGDGIHENWNVIGTELFPDAKLYIYDRYGKLLGQISPQGPGWDGSYLGRPLPSSDYWFKFEYGEGEVFTGHFALKR